MRNCTEASLPGKKSVFVAQYLLPLSLLLLIFPIAANGQCAPTPAGPQIDPEIQQRFNEKNWDEVVRLAAPLSTRSPDANFAYGMALAHLERWQEARIALLSGHHQCPREERFPVELAGVAFQMKRNPEAARWLRNALRLDPRDQYANDFAGTVYLLMGNVNAALKYWNRVQKPYIAQVSFDPQLRVQRLILDRAFAFSPEALLHERDYETTQARLSAFEIFPAYNIVLNARSDQKFDVQFHATERNGFGSSRLQALISIFSGAAYETIYPAYYNVNGSATNVESLLRWDSQKRRAWASVTTPLHSRPQWRVGAQLDARDENWAIRNGFTGTAPVLGSFDLERQSAIASVTGIPSGRLRWSTSAELSHRTFHNVVQGIALTPALVTPGFVLKALGSAQSTIFEIPERRFTIAIGASSELARMWPAQSEIPNAPGLFGKLQGSATAHWFPLAQGDVYELQQRVRAGHIFGSVPIDELYLIGIERDTDLWLRAHAGTRNGRKGSSPLANTFFLTNSDFFRRIYSNGLLSIKAGPLLDIARASAPTSSLSGGQTSPAAQSVGQWFVDTGAQVKLTVLGTSVIVTWGHDLRSGNNTFYAAATQR